MDHFLRVLVVLSLTLTVTAYTTDLDCSLNGVCSHGLCRCDPGWIGTDCGVLDLRAAKPSNGYNLTDSGTSSWGSHIVQDPRDDKLFHLFASELLHGCGLAYWINYSRIVRAESTTGPEGPYTFAAEVVGAFAHNPTVIYSPADKLYLLYHIGCPHASIPSDCFKASLPCANGTGDGDGISDITVHSSPDLRTWTSHGIILNGSGNSWDSVTTNPSAFPLYSDSINTSEILLAYRGKNGSDSTEHNGITQAASYNGTYSHASGPIFPIADADEDPFIWRDKRGNFHMLMHELGSGALVGRHGFATSWNGEWTYGSTVAYNTTVEFANGGTITYSRRERPQLYFSTDGNMTPLFMASGVQEVNATDSYSIIVPIGSGAAAYKKSLGF